MADEPRESRPAAEGQPVSGDAPTPESPENHENPGPSAGAPSVGTVSATAANGQPIYVNVQAPKRSNAPTVVLCVLVGILVLSLGSCAFAGSLLVGGMGSIMTSAATSVVADDSSGIAWAPSVAVIDFSGEIASGGSLDPRGVRNAFEQAESDPNVKAIVLLCNSPGGEASPSWDISQTVADCSKPVVVSVESMCASGAYMAASQADWIVAGPMSDIGAIGVYMQTVDASGLLDKLGVGVETIKSSDMKDMGSAARSLTDEERAYLQDQVDKINRIFIDMVAEGRGVETSEVEAWATGTTYMGQDALDMGLIDQLGTYDDALAKAAELGGLEEGCPTVVISARSNDDGLIDLLLGA